MHGRATRETVCPDGEPNIPRLARSRSVNANSEKHGYLGPGQMIAAYQHNISQHCWSNICKLRPNDRNISTQHIAILLSATCFSRLATLLQRVSTCCEVKLKLVRMLRRHIVARTCPNDYNIMQHPDMLHEKFDHFQI